MVKAPHPNDKRRSYLYVATGYRAEANEEILEHIRDADSWAEYWGINELRLEGEAMRAEHQKYLVALHKVCSDYSDGTLSKFPFGVARWLAQEAEKVCDRLPSRVLKHPEEGAKTADFAQENLFDLVRGEWEKLDRNPQLILQALSIAKEKGVLPPDWVLDLIVEAGAKVYRSDGRIDFGTALGLTPKIGNGVRSGRMKEWVGDLVAEGIDGGLSHAEARELAIFEAELVLGWSQYKHDTVQKYYETHTGDRLGFGRSFMLSLDWHGHIADPVYQSGELPFWRRKVLKARLEAYRDSEELFLDKGNGKSLRAEKVDHVVSKTVSALKRNQPPKDRFDDFIVSDF
jgi:hypothetical protein